MLRPLSAEEAGMLAELEIEPVETENAWIGIEDEAEMAMGSDIDPRTRRYIDHDLAASAMEGLTEEQRQKVRLRAAWLADRFIRNRRDARTLICDDCGFDPSSRLAGTAIRPRSLLDVHHLNPLAEGHRYTTVLDFELLCPTCHRLKHAMMRHRSATAT